MSALERLGLRPASKAQPSADQRQTRDTFAYKWSRRASYQAPAARQRVRDWLIERYCEGDPATLAAWLEGGRKLLLDAGCGAGEAGRLLFGDHLHAHDYLGVDISDAVEVARASWAADGLPGDFLQADLMDLPIPDASVDLALAEGVLHHTDDTGAAVAAVTRKIKPGGLFLFYVYRRKAPAREFVDDHIRSALAGLDDEAAWAALEPLSRLGQALGEMDVEVEVPEDVPLLGIEKGRYPLQRFIYWHFAKMFHHPDYTLEQMNHVNFDWYRPKNCHRHDPDEVRGFCERAGLEVERLRVEPAGITVVGRRR